MKRIEPIIPDIPNNRKAKVVKIDNYILLEAPNGLPPAPHVAKHPLRTPQSGSTRRVRRGLG